MDAIISDIHGNLEALDAVLEAIDQLGAKRIICLGDLVCYGPDSLECVRRSANWDVVIAGDWDLAILAHAPSDWNPTINQHIAWVRNQILDAPDSKTLLKVLESYRSTFVDSGHCFSHGTPNDVREWIFPEDVHDPVKLERIAKQFDWVCICGHSHIQGMFEQRGHSEWKFRSPKSGDRFPLRAGQKTIVSVGSVGQPRDNDPRASFLTVEGDAVSFHRVTYNVNATVAKIRAIPEIDNLHGERLLVGR